MAILYIEPTPGNGKGYLDQTYQALKKQNYQVEVVGHGYPPIFIWEGDRAEVERIAKDIDENVRILEQHRTGQDYSAELSNPQPHEERQRPEPEDPSDGEDTDSTDNESTDTESTDPHDQTEMSGETVNKDTFIAILVNRITEAELEVLCDEYLINYKTDLGQGGRQAKAMKFVNHPKLKGRLPELINKTRELYPYAFR